MAIEDSLPGISPASGPAQSPWAFPTWCRCPKVQALHSGQLLKAEHRPPVPDCIERAGTCSLVSLGPRRHSRGICRWLPRRSQLACCNAQRLRQISGLEGAAWARLNPDMAGFNRCCDGAAAEDSGAERERRPADVGHPRVECHGVILPDGSGIAGRRVHHRQAAARGQDTAQGHVPLGQPLRKALLVPAENGGKVDHQGRINVAQGHMVLSGVYRFHCDPLWTRLIAALQKEGGHVGAATLVQDDLPESGDTGELAAEDEGVDFVGALVGAHGFQVVRVAQG